MDKFAEISAKTKENLMEIFKEFYMEIYHKNKKKFMEKKNKNMKTFENLQKQEETGAGNAIKPKVRQKENLYI